MTHRTAVLLATAIMVVPLVGYPLVVGADGVRFPSVDDCVRVAERADEGELDLVFGRRDTPKEAAELLDRVDGCGRWKVLYDGIESYEQGLESRAEARGAGLEAELELEPPG